MHTKGNLTMIKTTKQLKNLQLLSLSGINNVPVGALEAALAKQEPTDFNLDVRSYLLTAKVTLSTVLSVANNVKAL